MNNNQIRDIPIDDSKVKKLKELMNESYNRINFLRNIFPIKKVEDNNKETEFFKIGINTILEKNWLIDQKESKEYWVYEELGRDFGRNIALAEIRALLDRIIHCDNPLMNKLKGELTYDSLKETINKNKDFDVIITNNSVINNFYSMPGFNPLLGKLKNTFHNGTIFGADVFAFSLIPKDKTLVLDSKSFAEVLEKKPLDLNIFEKVTKEEYIKSLPKPKDEDVENKIRILVYETLGLKIKNSRSLLVLEHK